MKTNKRFNLTTCKVVRTAMATLVVIIALALIALASCKDADSGAKTRAAEKITFGTDDTLYTMISCDKPVTDTQWTAVKSKLIKAVNKVASTGFAIDTLFNNTMNIDLLANTGTDSFYNAPDFTNKKYFLNADYVIGAVEDDLAEKLKNMFGGNPAHAQAPNPTHIAKAAQTQRSI
jgi:hypothetical protein